MTDVTAQAFREAAEACEQMCGHDPTNARLLLAAAEQREQLDAMQSRTFDYPTAWTLTRMTKIEQHHEKCSYRVSEGGVLCDCVGIDAFEIMVRGGRIELREQIATLTAENEALKAGIRGDLGGGNSLPDFWTAEKQLPYVAQRLNKVEAQLRAVTAERDEARAKIEQAQHYCDYYKAHSAIALELREVLK